MADKPKKNQASQASNRPASASASRSSNRVNEKVHYPLSKINFIMMAVCLLLIVIGFAMMSGSANVGNEFNYNIFESRRIAAGPVIAFLGFVLMAFAILYRKKQRPSNDEETTHIEQE